MDGYTMLECFPFDSSPEVSYDDWGYPRYDRAADAHVLRETFAKFFTDGVFPSPGEALAISKGKGLSVDIAPGAFVLAGAMGGVYGKGLNVALDAEPPKGRVCYGIMLRFDDRRTHRALFVRVAKSAPSDDPAPPEPESGPDVRELRLGHVTVPSGAADLSEAVVVNEKGLACCPYAAPFEEIDASAVVEDFRRRAEERLAAFGAEADAAEAEVDASVRRLQEFIARNKELIDSALDGTAVGRLQGQIDDLRATTVNEGSLDPRHLEMARPSPDQEPKLALKAAAVGTCELADGAVTDEKLAEDYVMRSCVNAPGGVAAYEGLVRTLHDIAVIRYNVAFNAVLASQETSSVVVWEFPSDATAGDGVSWDEGNKTYQVAGGAQ